MQNIPTLEDLHSLYKKITESLIKNKLTITTMESCTSGFIASLITDTEGSSAIFKGSCVTYSNEAKILNGVDSQIITEFGVYSLQTAEAMAAAIGKIYSSDIKIGVTGTFGNVDVNNADSESGVVFFAICFKEKMMSFKINLPLKISRFESKIFVAWEIGEILLEENELAD